MSTPRASSNPAPSRGPLRQYLRDLLRETVPTEVERALADHPHWTPDPPAAWCPRCGVTAGAGTVDPHAHPPAGCARCRAQPPPWQRLTRLSAYAEPVDGWIRDLKFAGGWSLAPWLGRQLARALPSAAPPPTLVVAVPLHWSRRWRRGYNQARLMSRALASELNLEEAAPLRRRHAARPQSRLSKTARAANLRRAFAAHPIDLTAHRILLVDDVKTTGATLATCTRLLKKQGALTVDCAVAAVTDPPDVRGAN